MFSKGLSLDQAPPIKIILRFFLTVPLFGVLLAIVILFGDSEAFILHTPMNLAVIHLFYLGIVMMTMVGALFQMLPVLAGVVLSTPLRHASRVHFLLTSGIMALIVGFFSFNSGIFILAGALLGTAVIYLLVVMFIPLLRQQGTTVRGIKIALLSLGLALILALTLLSERSGFVSQIPFDALKNAHLNFALLGWVTVLIISVAFQVIEMFYVTPAYPRFCTKSVPLTLFSLLILKFFALFFWPQATIGINLALSVALLSFILTTLLRLAQRKRPIADQTLRFWQLGLILMLVALLISNINNFYSLPDATLLTFLCYALGILSIITGMIYKIVPFLVWFHLNAQGHFNAPVMSEIIDRRWIKGSRYLFILTILSTLFTPFIKEMNDLSAILLLLFFLLLGRNLLEAVRKYYKVRLEAPVSFEV